MAGVELARVESRIPRGAEITDLAVLANHLARSGRFTDAQTGYQAFAKLLFGRDLGLSATAAMTGVHIIEGKPEISANVQAQMVRTYVGPEGERYDYKVLEHTGEKCRIEFQRRRDGDWQALGESEYTLKDAERAQLSGKANWKKHPRNMLFARAMSDGVAFHCPEVTNGIRTYHEGEIELGAYPAPAQPVVPPVDVPLDGEIVDGEIIPDAPEHMGNGAPSPVTPVEAQPAEPTEPTITAKQRGLLHARCRDLGLDDDTRHALIHCITGQPHSDRIPTRLFGRASDGKREGILGVLDAAKTHGASPEQLLQALREAYAAHGGPLYGGIGGLLEKINDVSVPF